MTVEIEEGGNEARKVRMAGAARGREGKHGGADQTDIFMYWWPMVVVRYVRIRGKCSGGSRGGDIQSILFGMVNRRPAAVPGTMRDTFGARLMNGHDRP